MSLADPYGDNRPVHLARFMDGRGRVSPWCYSKPRALPARARWAWQTPKPDVEACGLRTCQRCLEAKAAAKPAAEA